MSTINGAVNQLNTVASVVVITLAFLSCAPGIVGLILNVLVFTRPTLRREPCSLYFFSSTCFNLFVVFIVMPVRTVASTFNIDMANYNLGLCKIEFFAFFVARVVSFWLILLACIDRYFHSSINIRMRRLSSLKIARISIGLTPIVFLILYCHMTGYYEIGNVTNQSGHTAPKCQGQKGLYRTFIALWHMTFYSLCPSFIMLLFGILTLNNIRQQRRIIPGAGEINRGARRTDRQLLRMLTAQVLVIISTTLPYAVNTLYGSLTANVTKSTLRIAQENLATQTCNTMAYFAHTSSFFLYTLTGSIFRKELFRILSCCLPRYRNPGHQSQNRTNQISILPVSHQIAAMPNVDT